VNTEPFSDIRQRIVMRWKDLGKYLTPFAISSLCALTVSLILLILLYGFFQKLPLRAAVNGSARAASVTKAPHGDGESDYSVIAERNLFRAKLAIEIPKPKSEKELEEEALANIMRPMILKGVWIGQNQSDTFALIDKGAQKGIWIYRVGDTADRGLRLAEITQNSVVFKKSDFVATLRLFAKGYERPFSPKDPTKPPEPAGPPRTQTPVPKKQR
jgi:hypothetical protein